MEIGTHMVVMVVAWLICIPFHHKMINVWNICDLRHHYLIADECMRDTLTRANIHGYYKWWLWRIIEDAVIPLKIWNYFLSEYCSIYVYVTTLFTVPFIDNLIMIRLNEITGIFCFCFIKLYVFFLILQTFIRSIRNIHKLDVSFFLWVKHLENVS